MKLPVKKILITVLVVMIGLCAYANDSDDALNFFNSFVSASNNYSPTLLSMYSEHAKIIRQVVKPDGKLANAYFTTDQYKHQMKISAKLAKMTNYKNYYSDISVTKVSNGYKINSLRRPSPSSYKLKASMVVQKQPNGKWLIVEELMQTKEQVFLKYAK